MDNRVTKKKPEREGIINITKMQGGDQLVRLRTKEEDTQDNNLTRIERENRGHYDPTVTNTGEGDETHRAAVKLKIKKKGNGVRSGKEGRGGKEGIFHVGPISGWDVGSRKVDHGGAGRIEAAMAERKEKRDIREG